MIKTLAIANYRSLLKLTVPLGQLNLTTGPNGSGKSNLYRALRLLADTAQNSVVSALARGGGLQSTFWAGPEQHSAAMKEGRHPVQGTARNKRVRLRLGFGAEDFGYAISLGLPKPSSSAFQLDPEIKRETIWAGPVFRSSAALVNRDGPLVQVRSDRGWNPVAQELPSYDSLFGQIADPESAPEALVLRERIRDCVFTTTSEPTPTPPLAFLKLERLPQRSITMDATSPPPSKPYARSAIPESSTTPSPRPFPA